MAALECISPKDLTDVPLILPRRMNVRSELAHWFGEDFDRLTVLFTANLPSNACVMVYINWHILLRSRGLFLFGTKEKVTYPASISCADYNQRIGLEKTAAV